MAIGGHDPIFSEGRPRPPRPWAQKRLLLIVKHEAEPVGSAVRPPVGPKMEHGAATRFLEGRPTLPCRSGVEMEFDVDVDICV